MKDTGSKTGLAGSKVQGDLLRKAQSIEDNMSKENMSREQRLLVQMENKVKNHRLKFEHMKTKNDERQKLHKHIWQQKKFEVDGQHFEDKEDEIHNVQLMFDGKSYDQYYRDKYFEEVFQMNCPKEFEADHKYPTVVKPMFKIKSPQIRNKQLNSLKPHSIAEPFVRISIEEPTIMKFNTKSITGNEGENNTMNKYRYFNADKKGVKFIVTSTRGDPKPIAGISKSNQAQSPVSSSSLKLPMLNNNKQRSVPQQQFNV